LSLALALLVLLRNLLLLMFPQFSVFAPLAFSIAIHACHIPYYLGLGFLWLCKCRIVRTLGHRRLELGWS
jgi:hypothetical protein